MEEFFDEKTKKKAKDVFVKTAFGMIPWVGTIVSAGYELRELMKDRAREIKNKEVEEKVNTFHDRLFEHKFNVDENKQESFFVDYTKIIENMLKDDESEKAQFYANMLSFFTNQDIGKDDKIFLLSTLKELSNYEIGIIQKAIILKRFPLTTNPLPKSDDIFEPALKTIVQMGLFDRDGDDIEITKAGEFFSNSIFLPEQLLAETVGCKIFRATKVNVLCLYDLDRHSEYKIESITQKINSMLRNGSFREVIPVFLNSKARQLDNKPLMFSCNILILVYDKHFQPVERRRSLERYNLIKIYLKDDETEDPLKNLANPKMVSFVVSPKGQQIDSVIQEIGQKHISSFA